MDQPTTDLIQGTLDMLILKTLSLGPMHGYGIARRIEQVSRGVFKVNPGSLLTSLHRLERAGEVDDEVRDYFERARADLIRQGLTPEEAARVARRDLGDLAKACDALRSYGW